MYRLKLTEADEKKYYTDVTAWKLFCDRINLQSLTLITNPK
jgi:hypothetical protein